VPPDAFHISPAHFYRRVTSIMIGDRLCPVPRVRYRSSHSAKSEMKVEIHLVELPVLYRAARLAARCCAAVRLRQCGQHACLIDRPTDRLEQQGRQHRQRRNDIGASMDPIDLTSAKVYAPTREIGNVSR